MILGDLQTLFWDVDLGAFAPEKHPEYTIFRVLELGDQAAVAWLRQTFSEAEIKHVLKRERRLSPKSANFWALVYGVPSRDVAALRASSEDGIE